ncbi:MAG: sigma-70 factor domain-containing protein, partial [Gammaproteobacteria bacterium]
MGVDADNFVSKLVEPDNDDRAYDAVEIMVWLATADQRVTVESGITRYLEEIRRVPMLEPREEYMLAKRWREHGDHEAAHR